MYVYGIVGNMHMGGLLDAMVKLPELGDCQDSVTPECRAVIAKRRFWIASVRGMAPESV